MIKRKAYFKVETTMKENRIPILIGLRRTGKTTILKQISKNYKDSIILTFDDLEIRSKTDLELINYIGLLISSGKKYILIDEIQVRKKWDVIVKNLFDRYQDNDLAKFIVTGSSSLSFESKDTGVTRTEKILIHTLDFDEYLSLSKKEKLFSNFEHFLSYGGFPEFINSNKTIEEMLYLSLLPILNDDIPANYNININNLVRLFLEISTLTNGELNINRTSKNTGIKIETINNYLLILERTHLIKTVSSIKEDETFFKHRKIKVYINPHFHIFLLRKEFSKLDNNIKGHIVESYWLFWATQLNGYYKKFYYLKNKNGQEVDFVSMDKDGFKTLHELKYRDDAISLDYHFMKNIKSKNKVVWCKKNTHSRDGLVKFISILDTEKIRHKI